MFKGCECGSRVFKQGVQEDKQNQERQEVIKQTSQGDQSEADEDIAILIKEKGVYSVNIKNLAERESGIEPIFVQDTSGKINVLLNPEP